MFIKNVFLFSPNRDVYENLTQVTFVNFAYPPHVIILSFMFPGEEFPKVFLPWISHGAAVLRVCFEDPLVCQEA